MFWEVALHVLFVCTGNICRSPSAERLAATYAGQLRITDFTASSAGTRAVTNSPVHHLAAQVLEELGGDSSGFSARQLTPKIASTADLVLTMTRSHSDSVLEIAPRQLRRTFTLGEAARLISEFNAQDLNDLAALRPHLPRDHTWDIPDPIGQGPEVFRTVGSQIADLLRPVLDLCQRSSGQGAN